MVNFIPITLVALSAIKKCLSEYNNFSGFSIISFIRYYWLNRSFNRCLSVERLTNLYWAKNRWKGTYENVIAVVVWSKVPLLFLELFYIMAMILVTIFPGIVSKGYVLVYWSITGLIILWGLIIEMKGLSEVHKFPLGESFRCLFISFVIMAVVLFIRCHVRNNSIVSQDYG